jgi:hypothetical protein
MMRCGMTMTMTIDDADDDDEEAFETVYGLQKLGP